MISGVSYDSINIGSTERETETVKQIKVPDPANRLINITYFIFRSIVSAATVDNHAPNKSLLHEFSLRLPQTLSSSLFNFTPNTPAVTNYPLVTTPSKIAKDLGFKLEDVLNDRITQIREDQIQSLPFDTLQYFFAVHLRSFLHRYNFIPIFYLLFRGTPIYISFSTSKIEHIRSITTSGGGDDFYWPSKCFRRSVHFRQIIYYWGGRTSRVDHCCLL